MFYIAIGILLTALVLLIVNHSSSHVAGMRSDEFAQLAYAATLTTVIGAGVVFGYRGRLKDALRHAATWIALGALLVVLYAYRLEFQAIGRKVFGELVPGYASQTVTDSGLVQVRIARRSDGHFAASVAVNGTPVTMLVDTGASVVTLTQGDARAAGFDTRALSYTIPVSTANGMTSAAPVRLDAISIGSIRVTNLRALIARPGTLNESLLGINFLNDVGSYEVRGDALILRARP